MISQADLLRLSIGFMLKIPYTCAGLILLLGNIMQKQLITTMMLVAGVLLSGCEDKAQQEKIAQLTLQVSQLTAQNTALENALKEEKVLREAIIPVIFAEEEAIFDKSETVKFTESSEFAQKSEGALIYRIMGLKTNVDWLNSVLLEQLIRVNNTTMDNREEIHVTTQEQLIAQLQQAYDADKKDVTEGAYTIERELALNFEGQKERIATFSIDTYEFAGGAHGVGTRNYLMVDMRSHKLLTSEDIFQAGSEDKLKELIWQALTDPNYEKAMTEDESSKEKIDVTDNIYFDDDGVHFFYNVYQIGPYAAGVYDLLINWRELAPLLKPEFVQTYRIKRVK